MQFSPRRRFRAWVWLLAGLLSASAGGWLSVGQALACPFCSAQAPKTLREEIRDSGATVLVKLLEERSAARGELTPLDQEPPKTQFEVVHVLKAPELIAKGEKLKLLYFGRESKGAMFYVSADLPENRTDVAPALPVDPKAKTPAEKPAVTLPAKPLSPAEMKKKLLWTTPIPVSAKAAEYMQLLPGLPMEVVERSQFFLKHLESDDALIASDAYEEFARTPYEEIQKLKGKIDLAQARRQVIDKTVSSGRKGLFLTFLAVSGQAEDAVLLEKLIRDDKSEVKIALDAQVAAYLTLKGADGLPLVEELFLKNPKAAYSDTFSALAALRFHGQQEHAIKKEQLIKSMRMMLDRPPMADLVIPDLARWKDWDSLDRLCKLYADVDEKTSWVRGPIINYVRSCPLPAAEKKLKELEKIDPQTYKTTFEFFPDVKPEAAAATTDKSAETVKSKDGKNGEKPSGG